MIKIITLNTITEKYSVSLYNKNIIKYYYINPLNNNSVYIINLISQLLLDNNIKISNINLFIFNKGPGSFLAKRITWAILKCWNIIFKIPILGILNCKLILFNILNITYSKVNLKKNYKNIIIIIQYINKKFYFSSYFINKNNKIIKYYINKKAIDLFKIKIYLKIIKIGLIIMNKYIYNLLINNIKKYKIYIIKYNPTAYTIINYFLKYKYINYFYK